MLVAFLVMLIFINAMGYLPPLYRIKIVGQNNKNKII